MYGVVFKRGRELPLDSYVKITQSQIQQLVATFSRIYTCLLPPLIPSETEAQKNFRIDLNVMDLRKFPPVTFVRLLG